MARKINFLLWVFLFLAIKVQSIDIDEMTFPIIINYSTSDYNASTQNWSITQDQDNIMWFGNIGRALWYDGSSWGSVNIPNASIVRSVQTLIDNTILVGAFGDFGSIEKDEFGNYTYSSWLDRIPEKYRNFTDVWKIHELNNTIYIQTFEYILKFKNGEFSGIIEPLTKFGFSFISNGRLYVDETEVGLKVLLDNELVLFEKGDFFIGKPVWFVSHASGRLIVGTQRDGIYIYTNGKWNEWNTELNSKLKEHSLFSGVQLDKSRFLFGTVKNGIIITDQSGNIQKSINSNYGLQNNTVLSMFQDNEKNIWLGLDRGIDYIKLRYPFSALNSKEGFGTGYAAIVYKDLLFVGTNQGVFSWSAKENDFKIIRNSAGQVWSFKIIGDELYCCHTNGIYRIKNNTAELVFNTGGSWKIQKMPGNDEFYIAGNYTGLWALSFSDKPKAWPVNGFAESCRIFEFDDEGQLWISHGYKGVYKLILSDDLTEIRSTAYFGVNQGLPSNTSNEIFRYEDQIIVAASDGFYRFNSITGLMEPYDTWNKLLPVSHPVTKVYTDQWGRISLFNSETLSWAIFDDDSLTYFEPNSFLALKNSLFTAFENIYFLSEEKAIIGTINGFILYNRDLQYSLETEIPLKLKRMYAIENRGSGLRQTGLSIIENTISLPFYRNSLYIEFSVPEYQNHEFLEISYKIDNHNYVLDPGEYSILIEDLNSQKYDIEITARDLARNISSAPIILSVSISAPWYKSWYAYIFYSFILATIIVLTFLYLRKYFEKIKKREQINQSQKMMKQQLKLQQQAEEAEKELIIMRNEKLAMENRIKAEEIANSTMELVHKNKMLLDVKESLKLIQKENNIDVRNNTIKSIVKKIDRDLDNEEKWIVFEKNFDEVHENFLNRLKESHPSLTPKDLRLCAYLRMNLSSKEIAPLLRISIRSVEISRYRLRKKLGLPRDQNLSDYILLF